MQVKTILNRVQKFKSFGWGALGRWRRCPGAVFGLRRPKAGARSAGGAAL